MPCSDNPGREPYNQREQMQNKIDRLTRLLCYTTQLVLKHAPKDEELPEDLLEWAAAHAAWDKEQGRTWNVPLPQKTPHEKTPVLFSVNSTKRKV